MRPLDVLFVFILLMTTIFLVSLWVVDISLAGLMTNRPLVSIINIDTDPNFSYHAGLMVATIDFLVIVSVLFFSQSKNYSKTKNL